MTVWSFNGKSSRWGVGQEFQLAADGLAETTVKISEPLRWISAVTFLSNDEQVQPDTIDVHVANESNDDLTISGIRLWLPKSNATWQVPWPQSVQSVRSSVLHVNTGQIDRIDGYTDNPSHYNRYPIKLTIGFGRSSNGIQMPCFLAFTRSSSSVSRSMAAAGRYLLKRSLISSILIAAVACLHQ